MILIVNILAFSNLRRKTEGNMEMQTRSNVTSNVNQEQNQTIADENKKEAAKTLLLIAVFYSICMSPFLVYVIAPFIDPGFLKSGSDLMNFSYCIIVSNGGINSLIYVIRSKEIRTFYWNKFNCH